MTTLMEYKTLSKEILSFPEDIFVEKLSVHELITFTIDTDDSFRVASSRQELINRGKDNIPLRITIKKTCKSTITDLEVLLKRFDFESSTDKKITKLYKNRFLNTVSLLDKLQLEWQKHDLVVTR